MKTKGKRIWGVLVLIVSLGVSGIIVQSKVKSKASQAGSDSMAAMEMGNSSDSSMEGMEMGNDAASMPGMEMGNDSSMAMDGDTPSSGIPGYGNVKLDARKQQLIGVKTALVEKRTLNRTIRTYGTTSHDTELYSAQQEYLSAYRYYRSLNGNDGQATAKMLLNAARRKLAIMGYSDAQIDGLAARGQSDDSLIDGAKPARTWIYAQIYQKDLPFVQRGQRVRITGSELTGSSINGVIDSLDTVIDPETRSIRARILSDANTRLTHESYVNVDIEVNVGEVAAIPEEAVVDGGGRQIAFVSQGDGYYEPRELVLGRHAEGYYEVVSGVRVGEKVVNSANFFIDSESRLKAATGNMSGHQHR